MRRVLKGAFAYDLSLSVLCGWLDIKIQLLTNGIFMISWIVLGAMIFFDFWLYHVVWILYGLDSVSVYGIMYSLRCRRLFMVSWNIYGIMDSLWYHDFFMVSWIL